MPVEIGDGKDWVKLRVKLHQRVSTKNIHISTHSKFIKLNSPPHYRDVFLANPIDLLSSTNRTVCLLWPEAGHWDGFEVDKLDKTVKNIRKQTFLQDNQELCNLQFERNTQRKVEGKRENMLREIERQDDLRRRRKDAMGCVSAPPTDITTIHKT